MRFLLAILLSLWCAVAHAVVAFDAASTTSAASSGGPTYSWTHTPAGTPTAVGVWVSLYGGGNSVSGVTYGGVTMTLATSAPNGTSLTNDGDYLFGLANPPAGAQTVIVTTNQANQYIIAAAVTVTGSDTTTTFRNSNFSTVGSGTTGSLTLTTAAGDLFVDMLDAFGSSGLTPGGSQTAAWGPVAPASLIARGSYQAATTTSTTNTWSYTGSNPNTVIGGAFKVGSGGGGSTCPTTRALTHAGC